MSAAELLDLERSIQDKDQVQLSKFHLRLKRSGDPAHAIRYRFDDGAKPLWPSVTHAPEVSKRTVPDCPRCGSPRRFEFQVLPQIFYHLGVDSELHSADFGSVAVHVRRRRAAGWGRGHRGRGRNERGVPEETSSCAAVTREG